jgi:integrase
MGSIMALNLYRRHNQKCEGGHPEDSISRDHEERSKKWKRCGCAIYAAGSLTKTFKRLKTGRTDWDGAKEVAARWEAAGRWPGGAGPAPTLKEPAADSPRATVARAVEAYLAYHKKNSADNTWQRYKYLLKRILDYSAYKGYTQIDQWAQIDVLQCRDTWKVSQKSANSDMSVVKAFFEFCIDNNWLTVNPAARVKNHKSRDSAGARGEQKLPFSDQELRRMYEATETYGKLNPKGEYRFTITGKDLADFIAVSTYTGLRISDVSTFNSNRMNENGEVMLRQTKTGIPVSTWVPLWLQEIIRRRSLEVGPLIFGAHTTKDKNVIASLWRRKLSRLWRMCGKWEAKPTPHRFRHTFARVLLGRPGVTVLDVAELMGDTEAVIRKHYSAWIPGRQEKLTKILKEAFAETPRPGEDNVIVMPTKQAK